MKTFLLVFCGIIFLVCSLRTLGRAQSPAGSGTTAKAVPSKPTDAQKGERRFEENCARCHHAPESISPREVKAVVRHMRVRANLTAEDERLILKYLAP